MNHGIQNANDRVIRLNMGGPNHERIVMKLAGIILIVIGILALVYQGFTYTQTEKDAQLGPIQIQHQESHTVPLPPIVGAVCIVGGVVALALGGRKI